MVRRVILAMFVLLAVTAVPASAQLQKAFPRLRLGTSVLTTSGGGLAAGDAYYPHAAVVAWNRRWNSLTLYLLSSEGATCGTLRRVITRPGHLIQVFVTSKPRVYVGRPMADPQVAFLTIYRNPNVPEHVAGLKHGAKLTFTSVDSYPGGVWRGVFQVPFRIYADGKLYGYKGTFAAKWCELRH